MELALLPKKAKLPSLAGLEGKPEYGPQNQFPRQGTVRKTFQMHLLTNEDLNMKNVKEVGGWASGWDGGWAGGRFNLQNFPNNQLIG